ncbi:hypothetical protein KSP39_PZI008320 [Platanthera zijinensis]|uniref:WD repeat-containing protein 44 n=1 Tax=Platanthera zijinensis TaxID=2320716 RepID=A0AAP0G946_9ASPA
MMARGYFFRQEDDDLFLDPREDLSSVFDSCPTSPATAQSSFPEENSVNLVSNDPFYQIWITTPGSIQERRLKFMQFMGLDHPIRSPYPDSIVPVIKPEIEDAINYDIDRISSNSGAELPSSVSQNESPTPCFSDELPSSSQGRSSDGQLESTINDLNDGCMFSARDCHQNGFARSPWEDEKSFLSTIQRNVSSSSSNSEKTQRRKRNSWLRWLGVSCIVDRQNLHFESNDSDSEESERAKFHKIRVHTNRKEYKEFSAVYTRQNFKAHHGAILTMKFSPDGENLASAGEDGVVRVWKVMECTRGDKNDIPRDDPTCIYVSVRRNPEVLPRHADKEKTIKFKTSHVTSDSACVVVPPDVFHIFEKPSYEFYGHTGTVLDLAWSKDKHLLSSSVDKTVRLWQLGCDRCLKVFPHINYVTCVQFNPIDERYFVSGSLDGKVRIWEIPTCRVANWIDVKEIVTAVCYRPDGKGVIVGSMMGDCRFYDESDNHFQLSAKVSFEGKKKSVEKRITGFQFCPTSSRKLMVTSANSVIRILDGHDIVSKYKGLHNSGSQISAAFTSDGQHIISASENSKVYIWNHSSGNDYTPSSNLKSIRSSECFSSSHVSVAVPWEVLPSKKPATGSFKLPGSSILYLSPPSRSFSLSHEFFVEMLHRGSATWPEEKLPPFLSNLSGPGRSHFKFRRNSSQKSPSHAWGQVIVTAGWDGRIRSFQNFGLPVHP